MQETRHFARISKCSKYWKLRKNQEIHNPIELRFLKALFYELWE